MHTLPRSFFHDHETDVEGVRNTGSSIRMPTCCCATRKPAIPSVASGTSAGASPISGRLMGSLPRMGRSNVGADVSARTASAGRMSSSPPADAAGARSPTKNNATITAFGRRQFMLLPLHRSLGGHGYALIPMLSRNTPRVRVLTHATRHPLPLTANKPC
jgi:hypothetical protein